MYLSIGVPKITVVRHMQVKRCLKHDRPDQYETQSVSSLNMLKRVQQPWANSLNMLKKCPMYLVRNIPKNSKITDLLCWDHCCEVWARKMCEINSFWPYIHNHSSQWSSSPIIRFLGMFAIEDRSYLSLLCVVTFVKMPGKMHKQIQHRLGCSTPC